MSEQEKNWPKIYFSGLFMVIGALIVGGSIYFGFNLGKKQNVQVVVQNQPTIAPTIPKTTEFPQENFSNWKTYTEKEFSFNYPAGWKFSMDSLTITLGKVDETQQKVSFPDGSTDFSSYLIQISSLPNPKNLSAKDYYLSAFSFGSKAGAEKNLKDAFVGGDKGIAYEEGAAPASGPEKVILIAHGDKLYRFGYGAMAQDHLKFYDTFIQILSTFKFLNYQPVKISSPSFANPVTSPLTLKGTVVPGWMFEGVMPVILLDANYNEVARGQAKEVTPGSWSAGKDVAFSVTLTFSTTAKTGFLIFKADNPSGNPENDKSFEIPVKF